MPGEKALEKMMTKAVKLQFFMPSFWMTNLVFYSAPPYLVSFEVFHGAREDDISALWNGDVLQVPNESRLGVEVDI